MISVVMLTMWKCERVIETLEELSKEKIVDEIILIDNTNNNNKVDIPKVTHILEGKNTYVNPAWNKGVKIARNENILILNDDVWCDWGKYLQVSKHLPSDCGMVGLSTESYKLQNESSISIVPNLNKRPHGFACSFFVKKNDWVNIIPELLIYGGDDFLWKTMKNNGKRHYSVFGIKISGYVSKTVNECLNSGEINAIIDEDYKIIRRLNL